MSGAKMTAFLTNASQCHIDNDELARVCQKLVDAIGRENTTLGCHAMLITLCLIWNAAGVTKEQARVATSSAIDAYIEGRSN